MSYVVSKNGKMHRYVPTHFEKSQLNDLSVQIKDLFVKNNLTLAVAESFTGGSICGALVATPGASAYFVDGVVCYSHEAKAYRLSVPCEMLDRYGAVSEQTARMMLNGLLASDLSPSIALATTGNAGPGHEENSVDGEAYVAVSDGKREVVIRLQLDGEREDNICFGAFVALSELINFVKNQER